MEHTPLLEHLADDDPSQPLITPDALEHLVAAIDRYLEREQHEPVVFPPPGDWPTSPVTLAMPHEGRPLHAVLDDLESLLAATPKPASKRFFNQLYGGRDTAATLAEMMAVLANSQMHTFKVAGPQVLVEKTVLARMAELVGYPEGEGTFVPGGSMSNLVAMVIARNEAVPEARDHGLGGIELTAYTSVDSHYSIRKNMGLLGFGRANLRTVPVDRHGAMDPVALAARISADLATGARPVMINATAGTTVLGAFDPLHAIAQVAREHGIWLHVDGSYGGSTILSPRHRDLLAGANLSDSFAWNPHKMMGIPLLCSVLLVREPGCLARHLDESAGYLFQSSAEHDLGRRSIQCGRRNDALKLWCAWQRHGDEGYARRVDRQFMLAQAAADLVRADPALRLIRAPQSLNVCFQVRGVQSEAICKRLARDGVVLVGYAEVDEQSVIRLVCVDPSMTHVDLEAFFRAVKQAAAAEGTAASSMTSAATGADHDR